jgi:hypothetical protein
MTNCEPINSPIPESVRTEGPPFVSDAFTMFNPVGARI